MKLVLYSGGRTCRNHEMHQALAELARSARISSKNKTLSFTYVPFCRDDSESYFKRAIKRYQPFGFADFRCLKIDEPYSKKELKAALQSDVIYLAGGNTFYFLKYLRKSGFLKELKKFGERGGVIAGLSAGGILLTPTIALAGYPKFDADTNDVKLTDLRALGLTHFEFFPHYSNRVRYNRALEKYSSTRSNPIFAVSDGGGIIVDGETTVCIGKTTVFFRGMRIPVSGS